MSDLCRRYKYRTSDGSCFEKDGKFREKGKRVLWKNVAEKNISQRGGWGTRKKQKGKQMVYALDKEKGRRMKSERTQFAELSPS